MILSSLRVLLICLATFTATFAFGQSIVVEEPAKPTFIFYFFSFCCFVLTIPFIIQWVKEFFPNAKSSFNLLLSWIIGTAVSVVCYFLDLGIFGDFTFTQALASGFGATLASNGVFDSGLVSVVVDLIKKWREETADNC